MIITWIIGVFVIATTAHALKIDWSTLAFRHPVNEVSIYPGSYHKLEICAHYTRPFMHNSKRLKNSVKVDLVTSSIDKPEIVHEFAEIQAGTSIDMRENAFTPLVKVFKSNFPAKHTITLFAPTQVARRDGDQVCFMASGEIPSDIVGGSSFVFRVLPPGNGPAVSSKSFSMRFIDEVSSSSRRPSRENSVESFGHVTDDDKAQSDIDVGDRELIDSAALSISLGASSPGSPSTSTDTRRQQRVKSLKAVDNRLTLVQADESVNMYHSISRVDRNPLIFGQGLVSMAYRVRYGVEQTKLADLAVYFEFDGEPCSINVHVEGDVLMLDDSHLPCLYSKSLIKASQPVWNRIEGRKYVGTVTFYLFMSGYPPARLSDGPYSAVLKYGLDKGLEYSTMAVVDSPPSKKYSMTLEIFKQGQGSSFISIGKADGIARLHIPYDRLSRSSGQIDINFCKSYSQLNVEVHAYGGRKNGIVQTVALEFVCTDQGLEGYFPLGCLPGTHWDTEEHFKLRIRNPFHNVDVYWESNKIGPPILHYDESNIITDFIRLDNRGKWYDVVHFIKPYQDQIKIEINYDTIANNDRHKRENFNRVAYIQLVRASDKHHMGGKEEVYMGNYRVDGTNRYEHYFPVTFFFDRHLNPYEEPFQLIVTLRNSRLKHDEFWSPIHQIARRIKSTRLTNERSCPLKHRGILAASLEDSQHTLPQKMTNFDGTVLVHAILPRDVEPVNPEEPINIRIGNEEQTVYAAFDYAIGMVRFEVDVPASSNELQIVFELDLQPVTGRAVPVKFWTPMFKTL